ncbi:hypothetical protein RB195_018397 [Necator americanus]|uniref:Uncharacterized protein n=1 Tax=Necator americanus TaxID=51031 RepID=A0ABR1CBK2_NECAM
MNNIDGEYGRLTEHLGNYTRKAASFKACRKCLHLENLELMRRRGAAGATDNLELTWELAACMEATRDLRKKSNSIEWSSRSGQELYAIKPQLCRQRNKNDRRPECIQHNYRNE